MLRKRCSSLPFTGSGIARAFSYTPLLNAEGMVSSWNHYRGFGFLIDNDTKEKHFFTRHNSTGFFFKQDVVVDFVQDRSAAEGKLARATSVVPKDGGSDTHEGIVLQADEDGSGDLLLDNGKTVPFTTASWFRGAVQPKDTPVMFHVVDGKAADVIQDPKSQSRTAAHGKIHRKLQNFGFVLAEDGAEYFYPFSGRNAEFEEGDDVTFTVVDDPRHPGKTKAGSLRPARSPRRKRDEIHDDGDF